MQLPCREISVLPLSHIRQLKKLFANLEVQVRPIYAQLIHADKVGMELKCGFVKVITRINCCLSCRW